MRNLFLAVAVLLASHAFAGEAYLGAIVSGAGADTTNSTTSTPFVIPAGSKLTLYCSAAAYICTDTSTACTATGGANAGVPVAATTLFPTSVMVSTRAPTVTISGATSSIVRIVGSGAVTCYVWLRQGNE